MMKIKLLISSVIAGFCIAIGATLFLKLGGVLGACAFSVGLICIICNRLNLFTGASWKLWLSWYEYLLLSIILVGNIIGCFLGAEAFGDELKVLSNSIVVSRINNGCIMTGLMSIPCGFLMTTAVRSTNNAMWPIIVIMCVMTFIICGFPHCIADVYYYTLSVKLSNINTILPIYGATVCGNYIGCNLYRIYKTK